jgi:threonine synthase
VYPYVKDIVVESGGDFSSVSETEIREARAMAEELEGVSPCFSASTALAGLIKQARTDRFPRADTVLVNLTGGDRPRALPGGLRWLRRADDRWIEEI